ncbi:TPA: hypothetical protein ACGO93_002074, partial [Streptococcus suis]
MYFNRKNSQQKNWRMIKKGKHFLFGCALVFALGATANVVKADTVLKDSAVAVDNALPSSDSQGEADSEEDSSSQAAPAAIAYHAYEVRYVDENGQVIHKTANVETTGENGIIVQADAIPEGYELAQGQTEYVTHTFTAEEVNVVTIQIVKKAEVVHAADKTVLEQVTSEADLLADEALRQVAKEQAGNTALETAAQATKAAAQEAQVVLADTRAVQEVIDAQVELVKASTKALHDEMLKVDADGTVTAQLSTVTGSTTGTNPQRIYVFKNTAIKTVANGTATPDNRDSVSIGTITDPDGIRSMTAIGGGALGYTLNNAGEATGTPTADAGFYSRAVDVTDNKGVVTRVFQNSVSTGDQRFHTYILDTTTNTKATKVVLTQGQTLESRAADIVGKVIVNSGNGSSNVEQAGNKKYRKVIAPGQSLSAAGGEQTIMVRVITASNVYKDVPVYITAPPANQATGTNPQRIYVFKDTEIKTVANGTANPDNRDSVSIGTITDPDGIRSMTAIGGGALGYTLTNAGEATGTPTADAGFYSRAVDVTDNKGVVTRVFQNSVSTGDQRFHTYILDTTTNTKATKVVLTQGQTLESRAADIVGKVIVNSGNGSSNVEEPGNVKYRKVIAPGQTLSAKGGEQTIKVRVITASNVYKDVPVIIDAPPAPVAPEFKNTNSDRTTTPKDVYIWKDTPMRTEADLSVVSNGSTINEIYFVNDDTSTRTGGGLTVSNAGKVSGQSNLAVGTHNVDSIIKYNNTSEVRSGDRFWLAVMDAVKTGDVTKNLGDSFTADSLKEEVLNKVDVQKGNIPEAWGSTPNPDYATTKKIVNPSTGQETSVPTTPGTHQVTVRVTNNQGRYKDVVVNVTIPNPNTPTTGTNKKPLYVFNNTPIATVGAGTDAADNVNKVNVVTLQDPERIQSVAVTRETDVNTGVFTSNGADIGITIDKDGNATGTPNVTDLGVYSRGLTVTDGTGATTNLFPRNNELNTYVLDATAGATIQKTVGQSVTEQEILDNVTINPGKAASVINDATDPKFRKVLAPGQQLPTTPGTHTVTVRVITDSNVYKDVPVTVVIPANTAPTVRQDIPNQYVWKGTAVEPAINANVQDVNSTPERDDIKDVYFSYTQSTGNVGNPGAVSITKDAAGNYMISGTPVGEAGYTWNRKITAVDKQNATGQSNAFNINILDSRVKAEINKPANAEVTAAEVLEQVEVLSRTVEPNVTHDITTQLANDGGVTKKVLTDLAAMPKTGRQTVRVELTTPSGHKKTEEVIVNYPNVPTDVTAPTDIYTWANTDLTSPIVLSAKDAEGISSFKFKNTGNNLDGPVSGLTISNPVLSDDKYTATITGKYANSSAGNVVTHRIDATDTDGNVVRAGNNTVIRAIDITGGTMETRALNNPVTEQEIKEFVATKLNLGGQTDPGVVYELVENQTLPTSGQNNTVRVKAKIPNPTVSNGFQEKIVDVIVNYPNVPTDVTAPTDIYTWANTDLTSPIVISAKDVEGISSFKFKNTGNNLDGPVSGLTISSPVLSGDKYTATIAGKYANSSAGNRVTRRIDVTDTDGNIVRAGNNTVIHAIDITGGTMETRSTASPVTEQEIKDFVAAKLNLGGQTDPGVVYELVENQTLPTSGQNNTVRVRAKIPNPTVSNGFQEKIVDVTVNYDDPVKPSVTPKDNGSVEVVPPTGDDVKAVTVTYVDEKGTNQTVTATKGDGGTWFVPAGSKVSVDASTGLVTIPADEVQDGSTVSATANNGHVDSAPVTGQAKTDPDTTPPATPAIATDLTDKAGTTEPIKVTGAEPGTTVTLKDPSGNVIGTGTANDKG